MIRNTIFIISVFLAGIFALISSSNPDELKMNLFNNKPFFTIQLSSFGTSYFVNLNGNAIHVELDDHGQISTTLPVNHWMRSGANLIELQVLPETEGTSINPNSYINIELLVANNDNKEKVIPISSIKFKGSTTEPGYTIDSSKTGHFDMNMRADKSGEIFIAEINFPDICIC